MTPTMTRLLGGIVLVLAVIGTMSLGIVGYTVTRDLWWLHSVKGDGETLRRDLQFLHEWRLVTEQRLRQKADP